jgi:hypothetical protein
MKRDGVVVLTALGIAGVTAARLAPPAALPDGAFPVDRALARAAAALGDAPRTVGSDSHVAAAARLRDAFAALGAPSTDQVGWSCGPWGTCARVRNLVARIGPETGPAVVVVAHYDTVGASPGAADDGAGVAIVLELAAQYGAAPPPNPLVLLLTDAEELGMLGARHWLAIAPDDVQLVVNLEARGASGPSLLFETAGASGPLVARFARTATRPLGSSLFDTVYEQLDNDSDLTIFDRAGYSGINLSFIDAPLSYHTPLDRFAGLSHASVAHQGAIATALVASALETPIVGDDDVIWFDVLGLFVVRYPRVVAVPLAALAAAAIAFAARRAGIPARGAATGAALAACVPLGAGLAGFAVSSLVHVDAGGEWIASTSGASIALLSAGAAVGLAAPRATPADDRAVWFGVVGAWSVAGLACAAMVPGASHLWLGPSLAAAAVGWMTPGRATYGPALVCVAAWAPVLAVLYAGVGRGGAPAVAVGAGLATLLLGVAMRGRAVGRLSAAMSAAVAGLAAVGCALSAAHTDEAPMPLNAVLELGSDLGAGWVLEGEPAAVRARIGTPASAAVGPFAWPGFTLWVPATERELSPPQATLVSRAPIGSGERITVRIRSAREASALVLAWPIADDATVTVAGAPAQPTERGQDHVLWIHGAPSDGVDVAFARPRRGPLRLSLADETAGETGYPRPSATVPFGKGDRIRVVHSVTF